MHMLLESCISACNFIIYTYAIMNHLIYLDKALFYIRLYSSSLIKKDVDKGVL